MLARGRVLTPNAFHRVAFFITNQKANQNEIAKSFREEGIDW